MQSKATTSETYMLACLMPRVYVGLMQLIRWRGSPSIQESRRDRDSDRRRSDRFAMRK